MKAVFVAFGRGRVKHEARQIAANTANLPEIVHGKARSVVAR
jgi:hypothetical protein